MVKLGTTILLVFSLLISSIPPVYATENKTEGQKTEEKKEDKDKDKKDEKEKKKDDDKNSQVIQLQHLDPNWAAQFAVQLSAAITAIFALRSFPGSFKTSAEAFSDLKNFKEHREAYVKSLEEVAKFKEKKDGLLKELERGFSNYLPALKELDDHLRSALGADEPLSVKREKIAKDLALLKSSAGTEKWAKEIEEAISTWKERQSTEKFDRFVNSVLTDPFFTHGFGKEWLEVFADHRREVAARYWIDHGNLVEVNNWIEVNTPRTSVMQKGAKGWVDSLTALSKNEEASAKEFLREFSSFTRALNYDIHDPKSKFGELLTWSNREPGVFHTSDSGAPIPIVASQLMKYAKGRCDLGFKALTTAKKEAWAKGSYIGIPGQVVKASMPVITGFAGVGSAWLAFSGFWNLLHPKPKPDEKKDDKKPEQKQK